MTILFSLIIAIGFIATVVGGIWFLVTAFRTSKVWGIACIFVPFAGLVYLIKNWHKTQLAFALNLVGVIVLAGGTMGLAAYKASSAVTALSEDPFAGSQFELVDNSDNDSWLPQEATPSPDPDVEADSDDGFSNQDSSWDDRENSSLEEPEPQPMAVTGSDDVGVDPSPAVPSTDIMAGPIRPARQWGRRANDDEWNRFVNHVVEIHSTDKQAFKAILLEVQDEVIKIRQKIGTGHMIYFMERSKIIEIRVND